MTLLLDYWTSKRQTERQRLPSKFFQTGFDEFNIKKISKKMCCKLLPLKEL